MDEVLKSKWVSALRSGKYEQGCGRLRSAENKFCCLGVLCDVVDNKYWIPGVGCYWYINSQTAPPANILPIKHSCCLVKMNDEKRNNFEEIAQYIDKNL